MLLSSFIDKSYTERLNVHFPSVLLYLQIIQLVEGKASAYVFASPGCKKWDTCAPEAILHAVGGDNF